MGERRGKRQAKELKQRIHGMDNAEGNDSRSGGKRIGESNGEKGRKTATEQ